MMNIVNLASILLIIYTHTVDAFAAPRTNGIGIHSMLLPLTPSNAKNSGRHSSALAETVDARNPAPNFEDKAVPWTKARFHNSPLFRSGFILLAIALAGYSVTPVSPGGAALVHILSFSTWFGSMAYTTFVLGITMFKELQRKVFGKLQARLFPKYFKIGAICILLQIVTLPSIPKFAGTKVLMNKALYLSFASTLFNLFYLEPTSTQIMMERYSLEDIPGATTSDKYKSLAKNFGKFHGISSLTNLIAFGGAVAQGYYISTILSA